jgi:hypothetical protein
MTRLGWILLLCVAVDFSNPLLPGSVRLDPSESIAAAHVATSTARGVSSPVPARPLDRQAPPRRVEAHRAQWTRRAPVERGWALGAPPVRHHADDRTAASPAEDH